MSPGDVSGDYAVKDFQASLKQSNCTSTVHEANCLHVALISFINNNSITVSKSKSHYDRQSIGHSVLVSGPNLGPVTNFTLSLKFSSDSCRFVIL
jgi:hypothetical protein